ncbi:hypothetical protein [Qiania dongpingensis]|uniref:Uncharacterized protein n=1 Tax=Qiania dongpingensis TaxID=2763669 RepID=A0A7G9G6B2_9FIRM|nr:hypothetical protein [Qiania dongpingensis]QNM06344.1 hypothetical protein H9Q78_04195 [Qiania dongpingensis]
MDGINLLFPDTSQIFLRGRIYQRVSLLPSKKVKNKIHFVNQIVKYIVHNGTMKDLSVLRRLRTEAAWLRVLVRVGGAKVERRTLFRQNVLNGAEEPAVAVEALTEEYPAAANEADNGLQLSCNIDDVFNLAIVHNGVHIVKDICVKNVSETDWDNLLIQISSSNGLTEDFKLGIEKIKPGEELHFKNLNVPINVKYLSSLTERSSCRLTAGIYSEGNLLISETTNITVLAFDRGREGFIPALHSINLIKTGMFKI